MKDEPNYTWEKLEPVAFVEIAKTEEERAQGLMYRQYLQKDHGMYFFLDEERIQSFWMKNTNIPLSIAFINSGGIIVSIKDMRPRDTNPTSSDRPALYALEMDRGWFREKGIGVGDRAVFEDETVVFYRKIIATPEK